MNKWMMSSKGFTLLELMVVVSIIGILVMIAQPRYEMYQARARQKEGFQMLTEFHTKAQATRMEYAKYPGNLVQTGFAPVGQVNYRLRSADGNDIDMTKNDDDCITTGRDCVCAGRCPQFKSWYEKMPLGIPIGDPGGPVIGPRAGIGGACPPLSDVFTSDTRFVATVGAVISATATRPDRLGIDERKQIVTCEDGLK